MIWYHVSDAPLTGELQPLYLSDEPLDHLGSVVTEFEISPDAVWGDIGRINEQQKQHWMPAIFSSMDSIGYNDAEIQKLRQHGFDVVWDKSDFYAGYPQVFVVNPDVLRSRTHLSTASTLPSHPVYYHGTHDSDIARKIIKKGKIAPQKYEATYDDKASTEPMPGRIYLSPSLAYASVYTIGCYWDPCPYEVLVKEAGRYGYLFVIPSTELKNVEPDEDAVGRMLCVPHENKWLFRIFRDVVRRNYYEFKMILFHILKDRYEDYCDEHDDLAFKEYAYQFPYSFTQELFDCSYPEIAVAGKFLLSHASDDLIDMIFQRVDVEESIAHKGPVGFSEVWLLDKKFSDVDLTEDNFFSLAERLL